MSSQEQGDDIRESTPGSSGPQRATGGMGVSSEWVGPTGPGQVSTDGVRDVSPLEEDESEARPEQSRGGPEENPEGLEPAAGYPKLDPRSKDKPYDAPPQV